MGEPFLTVSWTDNRPCTRRGPTQDRARAPRHAAYALLHQRPGRLGRIEVVRVVRQEAELRACPLNELADLPRLTRGQIVQHDDVAPSQMAHQVPAHPLTEPRAIQWRPSASPVSATCRRGADHRHIVPPSSSAGLRRGPRRSAATPFPQSYPNFRALAEKHHEPLCFITSRYCAPASLPFR